MNKNLLLCGVGGQGIILTSKVISRALMDKGVDVMSAETIGMAQKGGSVFSFMRMGDNLYSPMFGKGQADIIASFEPAEAVRMLPYLKKGGTIITNSHPVQPITVTLTGKPYDAAKMIECLKSRVGKNLIAIDASKIASEIGSPKVLNMVMLGFIIRAGILPVTTSEAEEAMEKLVKPRFVEMNKKALKFN